MRPQFRPQMLADGAALEQAIRYFNKQNQDIALALGLYGPTDGETGVVSTDYPVGNPFRYGARGNGTADDTSAFLSAIRMGILLIPDGTFVVNASILPTLGATAIVGVGRGRSIIKWVGSGICVNVNTGARLSNLTLRDFTIDCTYGSGQVDAGVVQLNNAVNFIATRVAIVGSAGPRSDGFATSSGTTGCFDQCIGDGLSKNCFYQSDGSGYIQYLACRGINQALRDFGAGFAIVDGSADYTACEGENCAGPALLIYGAASGTTAPRGVTVTGGSFGSSYRGIDLQSSSSLVPRNITFLGPNCSNNVERGANILCGDTITAIGLVARRNGGAGWFAATPATNVHCIDPTFEENWFGATSGSHAAVHAYGVAGFTLDGGTYIDRQTVPTQLYAVAMDDGGTPASNVQLRRIRNDVNGSSANAVTTLASDVVDGAYDLEDRTIACPEGVYHAPIGSTMRCANGVRFVKETGAGSSGWRRSEAKTLAGQTVNNVQTTIAHGLGYTPSSVEVTALGNMTVWRSAASDATNVYLTASAGTTADVVVR